MVPISALVGQPLDATERALLLEVARRPDEDGPRWVYATWLTERGDPRGELIDLQLRRGPRDGHVDRRPLPSRRELEIFSTYGRDWLGSAYEAIGPREPSVPVCKTLARRFVRGFIAEPLVLGPLIGNRPSAHSPEPLPSLGEQARLLRLALGFYRVASSHVHIGDLHRVHRAERFGLESPSATGEPVALKVCCVAHDREDRSDLNDLSMLTMLLRREAELLIACRGSHIPRVLGLARSGRRQALALEWIDGVDLAELTPRLTNGDEPWSPEAVAALGSKLFEALWTLQQRLQDVLGQEVAWGPSQWGTLDRHVRLGPEGHLWLLDLSGVGPLRDEIEQTLSEFRQHTRCVAGFAPEYLSAHRAPPTPASDVFTAALALFKVARGHSLVPEDNDYEAMTSLLDFDDDIPLLQNMGALGSLLAHALCRDHSRRTSAGELARGFAALATPRGYEELTYRVSRGLTLSTPQNQRS